MPGINLLFYLQCHQNNTIRPKGGGLVKINNLKVFAVTETIYQHRSLVYKIWLWLKQHPLISFTYSVYANYYTLNLVISLCNIHPLQYFSKQFRKWVVMSSLNLWIQSADNLEGRFDVTFSTLTTLLYHAIHENGL